MRLTSCSTLVGLSLAGLLACDVESPASLERTSRAEDPIVNGQNDSGHPAIVALTIQGQAFCTGTLITPEIVVTAAHCIHPSTGVPANQTEIFFGDDVNGSGYTIPVEEGKYHPDWYLDDPDLDDDVAVLRLSEPSEETPIPMGKTPPVGSEVTLIGFGITSSGGDGGGTKRITTATIGERGANIFAMNFGPGATCNGDSGGPALFPGARGLEFVGIHTRSDCESYMVDERVDAHDDNFIIPFINETADCGLDGACAVDCPKADPDCPCLADGFCVAECETPSLDVDCDPACDAEGTCVTSCPRPDPDCAPVCVEDGECVEACGEETPDPDCDPCADGGCGGSGGGSSDGDGEEPEESCGCRVPGSSAERGGWTVALGLALMGWRRRRSKAPTSA